MEKQILKSPTAAFVEKNSALVKNSEKITIPLLLLGLILHFLEIRNTEFILILGCIGTAITYFLFAFFVVEIENLETTGILNSIGFINFIYKLTFFGLCFAAFSILSLTVTTFKFTELITVSGLTLIIVLILSAFTKVNDRSVIYNTVYYLRIIPALLILFYLTNIKFHWF
jgi:hypothetical protein